MRWVAQPANQKKKGQQNAIRQKHSMENMRVPSAEEDDVSRELASIFELESVLGELFDLAVVLELYLAINDVLAPADI